MALRLKLISVGLLAFLTIAGRSGATELLQATGGPQALFSIQIGDQIQVGRIGEAMVTLEAPPGIDLYSLQPIADGWVATGQELNNAGQSDLLLVRHSAGQTEFLPLPERGPGKLRGQPVPLVASGILNGLAWVEGNQQSDLQVWASSWNGSDWGDRESVSGPGPGSQLALTGTVLEDQSWILIWTRFDGDDDEIVYSRRVGAVWSDVERIHADNQVPDITPTTVALGGGALVAWSWFDGSDYRVNTGLFDGRRWILGNSIGDKGALFPTLIAVGGEAHLLFQTVVPETWTIFEIDSTAFLERWTSTAKSGPLRPLVVLSPENEIRLGWPVESGRIDFSKSHVLTWEPHP